MDGVFSAGGLFKNDKNLVAACTSHRVGTTDTSREHRCHMLQYKVANVMTHCIVDLLEPIQIHNQQGCLRSSAASTLQCDRQSILIEAAIGQSGQIIVQR